MTDDDEFPPIETEPLSGDPWIIAIVGITLGLVVAAVIIVAAVLST